MLCGAYGVLWNISVRRGEHCFNGNTLYLNDVTHVRIDTYMYSISGGGKHVRTGPYLWLMCDCHLLCTCSFVTDPDLAIQNIIIIQKCVYVYLVQIFHYINLNQISLGKIE